MLFKAQDEFMVKQWIKRNKWIIFTIVVIIVYFLIVDSLIPLTAITIYSTPSAPIIHNRIYPQQNATIVESISDSENTTFFIAGDLAIISFNITNTSSASSNQSETFTYSSSVQYLTWGQNRSFTLSPQKYKNFTEEFPLSEGQNPFYFKISETIGYGTYQQDLADTVEATSLSNALTIYIATATFILSMILGIPAICVGIYNFKKVCEKKKPETKETEAKETVEEEEA
jgi:hypothetical protein